MTLNKVRRCPGCYETRPEPAFRLRDGYCKVCRRAYNRQRKRELKPPKEPPPHAPPPR